MSKLMNFLGSFMAMILALASLYVWYTDGAWDNGVLPSDATFQILGLSGVSLLCFGVLRGLNKK